jgi:GT2 family glycosyltransferase
MVSGERKTVKQTPLVSIIVVTYNSEQYITKCLKSILNLKYHRKEIIVVDSSSTDSTIKLVSKLSGKLKMVESKQNLGYAGANNLGFSKSRGKYILLLNPDTEIEKDALDHLVSALEGNDIASAAQPSVFLYIQRKLLNLTGKEVHFLGFDWIRDYRKKVLPPSGEISSISGSAVLLRASTLKRIGLFDPEYFMYYEDSDLSWRMRLAGKTMVYVPSSTVYHDYKFHRGSNRATQEKFAYYERNRLITVLKNYELKTLFLLLPALTISNLGLYIVAMLQGWMGAKIKADLGVLAKLGYILKRRKEIAAIRSRSDRDLNEGFVSRMSFIYFDHPLVRYLANPFFTAYWNLIRPLI